MGKTLSLRKNFAWAFAGNTVSAFCRWLLLVVLIKLAPVETVGIFGVAQAVTLPVSLLFELKLQIVQVTDAKNEYSFGYYYALRLICVCLAVAVSAVLGFVFYSRETAFVITLLSIGYALMSVRTILLAVIQKAERMDVVAVSRFLLNLLSLIFFSLVFWITGSLVLSILSMVVARLTILLLYDIPNSRKFLQLGTVDEQFALFSMEPLWDKTILWQMAKTVVPLGLVGFFGMLVTSVPRLILDRSFGKDDVGYFAAMSSLLVAGNMIVAALNQSISPRLAKYYEQNIAAYKKLLCKLLGIGAILGILGIIISSLFGKLILTLMFRAEYAEYSDVFVWITVAGAILFIFHFMNSGLNAARRFKIQAPIYAVVAAICAGLSFLLIPHYGMMGAVWSIIACYCFGTISSAVLIVKAVNEKDIRKLA
jgi:O-antigen/teichoic acid export membrane protein